MPALDDKELARMLQETTKREAVLKEKLKKAQRDLALFKKLRKLLKQMAAAGEE